MTRGRWRPRRRGQAATAAAVPAHGVTSRTLAHGTAHSGPNITSRGPTDVTVRLITIAPGGSTGWHYHPGHMLAVIESGTLTRTLNDCSVQVSSAGDTVLEPAGKEHIHIGRNLGTEPVVIYATYFVPEGSPLAVPAEAPGCPPVRPYSAPPPRPGGFRV